MALKFSTVKNSVYSTLLKLLQLIATNVLCMYPPLRKKLKKKYYLSTINMSLKFVKNWLLKFTRKKVMVAVLK